MVLVFVMAGDTLAGIAATLWGDSALWYKLAEANGLSGDAPLAAGQALSIPLTGPANRNNADMFRPYDPGSAVGDLSPTSAKPPKKNKCGAFGQILIAAIAIAVAIALPTLVPALAPAAFGGGFIGGAISGAIGAAAGSVVSQGVGIATGIQQGGFSFKQVALSALSGAVGGGLSGVSQAARAAADAGKALNGFQKAALALGGKGILAGAARGIIGSTLTQGIGVVTGLQAKFDWAGVAAAGVGGGVSAAIGVDPLSRTNRSIGAYLSNAGASMASDIANAATRSVINGSDFGDNILAALPDVLGQTIGGIIADGVARSDMKSETGLTTKDAPLVDASAGPALSAAEATAKLKAGTPQALASINEVLASGKLSEADKADLLKSMQVLEKASTSYKYEEIPNQPTAIAGASLDKNGNAIITINPNAKSLFDSSGNVIVTKLAYILVHEARHAYDIKVYKWDRAPRTVEQTRLTERNAYRTMAVYIQAVGETYGVKNLATGASENITTANSNYAAEASVESWAKAAEISAVNYNKQIDTSYAKFLKSLGKGIKPGPKPNYIPVPKYYPPEGY